MLPKSWQELIFPRFSEERFHEILNKAEAAYAAGTVYPPREDLFSAFSLTPPETVKAVILGQDPYHEPGQAHGLAFSVPSGVRLPPSLRNIYKELESDLGLPAPQDGDLRFWAEQGVLLLNTTLTVEQGRAGSHAELGWQDFTHAVVESLSALSRPVAFVLWGAYAAKKAHAAQGSVHPRLVLTSPHPSPLSVYRGFYGSKPFSQVNSFLHLHNQPPIDWRLPALEPNR